MVPLRTPRHNVTQAVELLSNKNDKQAWNDRIIAEDVEIFANDFTRETAVRAYS